jgi:arylformamidase
MVRYHDITLPITDGMITYPDDPAVRVRAHARIADGEAANVTALSLGSHTGTHVDAPRHFLDGGRPVDELALERLLGPARVVRIPDDITAIGASALRSAGVGGEARVLLRTRNAALLGRPGFQADFAHLTEDGARYLVDVGVRLVGIDYLSIEAFDAREPVVHRTLLERDVVILEGLDLRDVAPGPYELVCLPLRLAGLDGSPVRALLRAMDDTVTP